MASGLEQSLWHGSDGGLEWSLKEGRMRRRSIKFGSWGSVVSGLALCVSMHTVDVQTSLISGFVQGQIH